MLAIAWRFGPFVQIPSDYSCWIQCPNSTCTLLVIQFGLKMSLCSKVKREYMEKTTNIFCRVFFPQRMLFLLPSCLSLVILCTQEPQSSWTWKGISEAGGNLNQTGWTTGWVAGTSVWSPHSPQEQGETTVALFDRHQPTPTSFLSFVICSPVNPQGFGFVTVADCEIAAVGEQSTLHNFYKIPPFSVHKGFLPKGGEKWRLGVK